MTRPDRRACRLIISIPTTAHAAAPAALTSAQCRSLLDHLAQLADPRHHRGRRHPLAGVLGVAVAAVLAGARSLAAIGEWPAGRPAPVLAALGAPSSPDRCLQVARRGDRAPRAGPHRPRRAGPRHRRLAGRPAATTVTYPAVTGARRPHRAVAVDGKTLRGSGRHRTAPMHLLAAMDHTSGAVLAQPAGVLTLGVQGVGGEDGVGEVQSLQQRPGLPPVRWRGGAPNRRFQAAAVMAAEAIPVEVACRVLDVPTSGSYAWRARPPSQRAIRHAWLTELIGKVHHDSRGTYGALRVHAELRLGYGIVVGHNAIALLMRRAGRAGATGRPKWRHAKPDQVAADLVDRQFSRAAPNQLWVTDITEHPTREGKVYCAVVLDTFSRRVVGWSIDATPTAALVTNALGMAIQTRTPAAGAIIHSDQGVQFASWAFTVA